MVETQMLKPSVPRVHCRRRPGMVWHGCGCSVNVPVMWLFTSIFVVGSKMVK